MPFMFRVKVMVPLILVIIYSSMVGGPTVGMPMAQRNLSKIEMYTQKALITTSISMLLSQPQGFKRKFQMEAQATRMLLRIPILIFMKRI